MIAARIAMITALVLGAAAATAAQTHRQLLERAIFAEETAGDLPAAIRIYSRLASERAVPREIATHARTRLTETRRRHDAQSTMLAKAQSRTPGPAQGGATMARPVTRAAGLQTHDAPDGCCGMFSANYDPARPIAIQGIVSMVQWINPQSFVVVEGSDGNKWAFTLASPNMMVRAGLTRNLVKLGDAILVQGVLAKGTVEGCPSPLPNSCAALQNGALHASASVITGSDGTTIFDRTAMETEQRRLQLLAEQEKAAAAAQ